MSLPLARPDFLAPRKEDLLPCESRQRRIRVQQLVSRCRRRRRRRRRRPTCARPLLIRDRVSARRAQPAFLRRLGPARINPRSRERRERAPRRGAARRRTKRGTPADARLMCMETLYTIPTLLWNTAAHYGRRMENASSLDTIVRNVTCLHLRGHDDNGIC